MLVGGIETEKEIMHRKNNTGGWNKGPRSEVLGVLIVSEHSLDNVAFDYRIC